MTVIRRALGTVTSHAKPAVLNDKASLSANFVYFSRLRGRRPRSAGFIRRPTRRISNDRSNESVSIGHILRDYEKSSPFSS